MNSRRFKILFFSLWILLAAGLAGSYFFKGDLDLAQSRVSAKVKEIEGYKSWKKVNKKPEMMRPHTVDACALPEMAGGLMVNGVGDNPHLEKYITVYVNAKGEKAMMEQKTPDFPEGSVIVKEKLSSPESTTPELMTVMIKQKKGSNRETGDWEYMVTDGKGEKVEGRGNLANCKACHDVRKTAGYVFRSYVDWEYMKKWK